MSSKCCAVRDCPNSFQNTKHAEPKIRFYSFSTKTWLQDRMKTWIKFTKRINDDGSAWAPNQNSFICSAHFVNNEKSEDPRSPSYNPTIRPLDNPNSTVSNEQALERYKRKRTRDETPQLVPVPLQNLDNVPIVLIDNQEIPQNEIINLKHDVSSQTEDMREFQKLSIFMSSTVNETSSTQVTHEEIILYTSIGVGPSQRSCVFTGFDSVKYDDKKMRSLTSLDLNSFSLLLSLLPTSVPTLKYEMTWENRLLLFLMKLKMNMTFLGLSTVFNVSHVTASNTFSTVLNIIHQITEDWIFWPSREATEITLPKSFKLNYPKCRVIIDCTEVKSEMPGSIEIQNYMYSNYKSTWTVKFLIGIAPSGLVTFLSKGYGGRSSDTFITQDCGILNKLEPGDIVMSDKGFPNLQVIENVVVVLPPFSKRGQAQFTEQEMTETYNVASVRIHVERAIQRFKIYDILTDRLTIDLLPNIDKIAHVCAILVNLQPPIIKEK